jgi:hypothetical protein
VLAVRTISVAGGCVIGREVGVACPGTLHARMMMSVEINNQEVFELFFRMSNFLRKMVRSYAKYYRMF